MTQLSVGRTAWSRRWLLNRSLLSLSGLLFCTATRVSQTGQVARLDFRDPDSLSTDSSSGIRDSICNRNCKAPFGKGLTDGAFRVDGYSTWLTRVASSAPVLEREFTIEAVTALESYPTAEAAFVNQRIGEAAGYFFGV